MATDDELHRDPANSPAVDAAVTAIHAGDVASLRRLLAEHPELATARVGRGGARTLLHVVADWPGYRPNAVASAAALIEAGADVDAPHVGGHQETPLHWAASNDDVALLDALLDAGANIEARGGVIGDGAPLFDAAVFGQWKTAARLLERGAIPGAYESAALGLLAELQELFRTEPERMRDELDGLFWGACHGGQRAAAEFLREQGADLNWVGWDDLTGLDAARREGFDELASWLESIGAQSAGAADR